MSPTLKKLYVAFVFSLLSTSLFANDTTQMSPARNLEVTIVTGKELPKLLNQSVEPYSVMAIIDNSLAPIPFQFDDLNVKNLVHVPGGKLPPQGQAGIFEENDELAFMYKDMGQKATAEQLQGHSAQKQYQYPRQAMNPPR